MKIIAIISLAALSLFAADDKAPAPPAPAKEGTPTEVQLLRMQKAAADAKVADAQYKPSELQKQFNEYQEAIKAAQAEFAAGREPACEAIGVPKDKMAECVVDLNYADPATKKVVGKVSWTPAVPAPASVGKPPAAK